jgi:arylsulfatase A-like enzyme
MTKKRFLLLSLLVLVVFLLWPIPRTTDWQVEVDEAMLSGKSSYLKQVREHQIESRPNVVLVMADDLGKHDISLYGHSPLETPNLDALGKQGVTYQNAFVTAPICSPSRAGLLTGRYQNRFGFETQPMTRYIRNRLEYYGFRYLVETNEMLPIRYPSYPSSEEMLKQGLPVSEITLAELMKEAGYRTGIFGKWHLGYGEQNHPTALGFDEQYGFLEAFSLFDAEDDPEVVNHHHDLFWEEHIWSQQRAGHSAITRNGKEVEEERYLTDAIVEEAIGFMDQSREQDKRFFAYLPFSAPHTPFQARKEDYDALAHVADHNQRVYLAMIRRLDWAMGQLMTYLQDNDLAGNTLVIFTSDNGGAAYTKATDNGPLRAGKFSQFDGGLAVPMMAWWPGTLAIGHEEAPTMTTDWFVTLTAMLGLDLPGDRVFDGVDLFDEMPARERPLFWRSDYNLAVRSGDWKLLLNRKDETVHLYRVGEDIGEIKNLADDHPQQVQRLIQLLAEWEASLEQPKWPRVMDYLLESEGESFWFAI